MWVATKCFFLAKAKTGNSFGGGIYSNLNVFRACLIHIS